MTDRVRTGQGKTDKQAEQLIRSVHTLGTHRQLSQSEGDQASKDWKNK